MDTDHLTVNVDVDVPNDYKHEAPEVYTWDVDVVVPSGRYKTGLSVLSDTKEGAINKAGVGLERFQDLSTDDTVWSLDYTVEVRRN